MRKAFLAAALWGAQAGVAGAHPGGLNAEGCHNNRKTGDYHCHRAPSNGPGAKPDKTVPNTGPRYFAPLGAASASPPGVAGRPTCHVGPRGGTYTITASGRKNYSGC